MHNRIKVIIFTIFIITNFLIVSSCSVLNHSKKSNNNIQRSNSSSLQSEKRSSYITIDELLFEDESTRKEVSSDRTVLIDKIDILEKCERNYFEIQKYYKSGKLHLARIKFENILENLEYLYEDEKVSDSLMLKNFVDNFKNGNSSSGNNKDKQIDIFSLYNLLFSSLDFNNDHEYIDDEYNNNSNNSELTIEQIDNYEEERNKKNSSSSLVRQNNKEYLFVKSKIDKIIDSASYSKSGLKEFTQSVYEAYIIYLEDKFSLQELFLRSGKYDSFVKSIIRKEKLSKYYAYLPAIMSSYYTGRNSGGLWQLDNTREYRKLRKDVVASTAIVISKIKKNKKLFKRKKNLKLNEKIISSTFISSIVSERSYNFKSIEDYFKNEKDFFNSDFSDFIALEIILNNPDFHGLSSLKKVDNSAYTKSFLKSYERYKSNPSKYSNKISRSSKKKRKSTKSKKSPSTSNNKSYVRLKYKVRKGDFLQKIATLYKCSIKDIKRWNPKSTKGKNLYVGTILYLRGYKFVAYKARRGDTIAKICSRRKMKMSTFMKINNLRKKTIYRGRTYYVYK